MNKSLLIAALTATIALSGCAGDVAGAVSNQIAIQADSFNVSRKVTVIRRETHRANIRSSRLSAGRSVQQPP